MTNKHEHTCDEIGHATQHKIVWDCVATNNAALAPETHKKNIAQYLPALVNSFFWKKQRDQ